MQQHNFAAVLERDDRTEGTFVRLPVHVMEAMGIKGRAPVRGAINGMEFLGSVVTMGGECFMGINRQLRQAAGLAAGSPVSLSLEIDQEPRLVEVPADLAAALKAHPAAEAAWQRLSYSHRRQHVTAIENARKPETRSRRIERTLAALQGNEP